MFCEKSSLIIDFLFFASFMANVIIKNFWRHLYLHKADDVCFYLFQETCAYAQIKTANALKIDSPIILGKL